MHVKSQSANGNKELACTCMHIHTWTHTRTVTHTHTHCDTHTHTHTCARRRSHACLMLARGCPCAGASKQQREKLANTAVNFTSSRQTTQPLQKHTQWQTPIRERAHARRECAHVAQCMCLCTHPCSHCFISTSLSNQESWTHVHMLQHTSSNARSMHPNPLLGKAVHTQRQSAHARHPTSHTLCAYRLTHEVMHIYMRIACASASLSHTHRHSYAPIGYGRPL